MKYEPQRHHRRSVRLSGYDYAQAGAYFVTICTKNRECLFGEVVDGEMRLNDMGRIVAEEWVKGAEIRREIELDEWVVMPNHLHGIVKITVEAHGDAPTKTVGAHGNVPIKTKTVGAHGDAPTKTVRAHGRAPQQMHGNAPLQTQTDAPPQTQTVGAHGRAPLQTHNDPTIQTQTDATPPIGLYRPPKSLGSLIAGFKSTATRRLNVQRSTPRIPVWQRNYYEHIIRNDESLNRIREYIINNPLQWALDCENPANFAQGEP